MASIYDWSKTPATNGTADASINWQEGQPPSTVNDSARQMMARVKEFIDDGCASSAGSANAITVTLSSGVTSYFEGLRFSFKAANTNTAAVTINVNGIGAKSVYLLREGVEQAAGSSVFIAGAVYQVIYLASLGSGAGGWLATTSDLHPRTGIASAATTDLGSVASQNINITGTTTITSFGTAAAGAVKFCRNGGAGLTITHNATSLILPGAANIQSVQGDHFRALSLGSGNWVVTDYTRVNALPLYQGLEFGLTIANNTTDATNDIDIAVGAILNDTAPNKLMSLASGLTKQLDAAWAVGTNQGMRDTGSIADGWWYIYAIQRSDTGVVEVLASLSATAPTMPANYDRKRLIGAIVRESGAIRTFRMYPDRWVSWDIPPADLNSTGTVSTAGALVTLTAPRVAGTAVKVGVYMSDTGANVAYVRDGDASNDTVSITTSDVAVASAAIRNNTELTRYVNSSGQVRYRASGTPVANNFVIKTNGFRLP